ncbi:amidohydrolase [Acinetobacter sp. S40]|uniref:amidohydrolase n=1 Tax=Acinetobacter sp. S40 TaxID=2767434 RepID=UPI001D0E23D7|nr:amidohydrolase [Acinetobacter sp. S40]
MNCKERHAHYLVAVILMLVSTFSSASEPTTSIAFRHLQQNIDQDLIRIQPTLIQLRHKIHAHPELANQEYETSQLVAEYLTKLGLEVQTGIAKTGVVATLKGKHTGPVIALRAELDALPIKEQTGLSFASTVKTQWNHQQVDVMHACGHDSHIVMLLAVADAFSKHKDELRGTIKFIFQPAEEGPPENEEGGAKLMIKEGVLTAPKPDAIIMLHVGAGQAGSLSLTQGIAAASSDRFKITIQGKQAHTASPWNGVDPIQIAAEVISSLQLIPSRQIDLVNAPAPIISFGQISGGTKHNIIPEQVTIEGTLRTKSNDQRAIVLQKMQKLIETLPLAYGGTGHFFIDPHDWPAGYNQPELSKRLQPILETLAKQYGTSFQLNTVSGYHGDDFWEYAKYIPAVSFGMGVTPQKIDPKKAVNHSPFFQVDDSVLIIGEQALSHFILDFFAVGKQNNAVK